MYIHTQSHTTDIDIDKHTHTHTFTNTSSLYLHSISPYSNEWVNKMRVTI